MFEGVPEPMFVGRVQNVTVSQGREVVLTCTVKHLGPYRVRQAQRRRLDCVT